MTIVYGSLGVLILLLGVVIGRAIAFKPRREPAPPDAPVTFDADRAVESLAEMIRCKTVSSSDWSEVDESEFEKFRKLLQTRYPVIHKTCTLERIGRTGLLYLWKGQSSAEPTVLMSHYDVVPADEAAWDKPPFDGIVENGVLWGRGTLDTKGSLCGVMESAEMLIGTGFAPQNDIYFSFAGDEEVAGAGAPMIVDELERRGIRPALVVDEGGAVVENVFPGVQGRCALVGIAEKGMLNLEFTIKSTGGHASEPPRHGPVGKLSQAILDVENHPFPSRLTPAVAGMYDTLGRHSSFFYRMIFANLWLFMPILNLLSRTSTTMNAMLRTTCAFTMTEASKARNVLPPQARAVANLRLIGGDTPESAIARIRRIIKNDEIELTDLYSMNPSPASDMHTPGYAKLQTAIRQTWGDVIISPYLMMACSDSRHFCRISNTVMRFSPIELGKQERGTIHAHNERITTDKIADIVAFYIRLVQQL